MKTKKMLFHGIVTIIGLDYKGNEIIVDKNNYKVSFYSFSEWLDSFHWTNNLCRSIICASILLVFCTLTALLLHTLGL